MQSNQNDPDKSHNILFKNKRVLSLLLITVLLGIIAGGFLNLDNYFRPTRNQEELNTNFRQVKSENEVFTDTLSEESTLPAYSSMSIEFLSDLRAKVYSENAKISFEIPILPKWVFIDGNSIYKHSEVYAGVNFSISKKDANFNNADSFIKKIPNSKIISKENISLPITVNIPAENYNYYDPVYKSEVRNYNGIYLEIDASLDKMKPFSIVLIETEDYFINMSELWKFQGEVAVPRNQEQLDAKKILDTAVNSITITQYPENQ